MPNPESPATSAKYSEHARLIALALIVGCGVAYGVCATMNWRLPSVVRQIEGDLLMNLLWLPGIAALVTAAVTVVAARGMSLLRSLDRVVWRVLLASIAAGALTLPWWPELKTLRLILPGAFSLVGARLGRIAGSGDRSLILATMSAVASALLFAFISSDLLGLGDYGAGPVVYALSTGMLAAILAWVGCRLLRWRRANGA